MPKSKVLRYKALNAPHVLDPTATSVAVNVLDTRQGGIFCIGGKSVLPVGARIWVDPILEPDVPDAGWTVMFRPKGENVDPIVLDHYAWQPYSFDLTKPGVTVGMISAVVEGVRYDCFRTVTVIEKEESGGSAPVITTTTLPSGYVNVPYRETLQATGTPDIAWSPLGALPTGLTLSAQGVLSGTPVAEADHIPVSIRAMNAYGSISKTFSFSVLGEYSLDVTVASDYYPLNVPIPPEDIVVKYHGEVIPYGKYALIYNCHIRGLQEVTVTYDPISEEIGKPATAKFTVTFDDQP